MYSTPSIFTSVPLYLPISTRSPFLTSMARRLPSSVMRPGPTATTSPSWGFSLAVSGMMMPPRTVSFSSMRRTRMRSARGWIFMSSSWWIQVGPSGATWKWLRSGPPGSLTGPDRDCARHHSAIVVLSSPVLPSGHTSHASRKSWAASAGSELRTSSGPPRESCPNGTDCLAVACGDRQPCKNGPPCQVGGSGLVREQRRDRRGCGRDRSGGAPEAGPAQGAQ